MAKAKKVIEEVKLPQNEITDNNEKLSEPEQLTEIVDIVSTEPEHVATIVNDNVELSLEQKIINFLSGKTGEIRLNEFLKSAYGPPKANEKPIWVNQNFSKSIRATLDGMVKRGEVRIINDQHLKLGQFFYIGHDPVTHHYDLTNTNIIVAL